jgi:RNA polymerase sigma-B factor
MATQSATPLPADSPDPVSSEDGRCERLLAQAQECSDPRLREQLHQQVVMENLHLADSTARRYRGRGLDLDDLVQVARLALVKAVRGYRCGRGHSFAGYAIPTVSGELKRHFRDCGWDVRPPRRLQEARSRVLREEEQLWHDLRRQPSIAEVADAIGLSVAEVRAAKVCAAAYNSVPLDAPAADGRASEPADPGDVFARFEEHEVLAQAIRSLPRRDQLIVQLRFVEELTQSQIGEQLGVSQMQVSRLLSRILRKLNDDLRDVISAA